MPTYEYVCNHCDHEFELFQQMSAPVKRKCPECGTLKLRRLIGTGAGVIFKGSGFYETDYRSESYKKAAQAESSAANGSDKSKDTKTKDAKKTDSKPDTTPKSGGESKSEKAAKPKAAAAAK